MSQRGKFPLPTQQYLLFVPSVEAATDLSRSGGLLKADLEHSEAGKRCCFGWPVSSEPEEEEEEAEEEVWCVS